MEIDLRLKRIGSPFFKCDLVMATVVAEIHFVASKLHAFLVGSVGSTTRASSKRPKAIQNGMDWDTRERCEGGRYNAAVERIVHYAGVVGGGALKSGFTFLEQICMAFKGAILL